MLQLTQDLTQISYTWHEVGRLGTCYSMLCAARHSTADTHLACCMHFGVSSGQGSVALCMPCSVSQVRCQKLVGSTAQCMLVYMLVTWMTKTEA